MLVVGFSVEVSSSDSSASVNCRATTVPMAKIPTMIAMIAKFFMFLVLLCIFIRV